MSQEVSFLQQNQRICSVKALQIRKEDKLILEQLFKVHMLAAESLFHSPVPANSSMQHVPNVLLSSKMNKTRTMNRVCTCLLVISLHKVQLFFILAFAQIKPQDSVISTLTNALTCCQKSEELQNSENSISFMMPSPVSQRKADKTLVLLSLKIKLSVATFFTFH